MDTCMTGVCVGKEVQVKTSQTPFKRAWLRRLKLKYDELLSSFAFIFCAPTCRKELLR